MRTNFWKKSPPCIKIPREFNVYIKEQSQLIQSQLIERGDGSKSLKGEKLQAIQKHKSKTKSKVNSKSISVSSRQKSSLNKRKSRGEKVIPREVSGGSQGDSKIVQIMKKIE